MNDVWTRIHSWLSANAPKISHSLSPAASASQLAATEQALGREMPAEWRELYQTHNGMSDDSNLGSLFYGMKFLTLDEAVQEHSNSNTAGVAPFLVRSADPGINRADMCNPNWIAFARACDTLLCVDTDPATDGCFGQVIFTDHAFNTVILLAKSLAEFLAEFARDLEGGRYFLNQDALKDGVEFLDCAPEIDIVNWHRSPRWKHLDVKRLSEADRSELMTHLSSTPTSIPPPRPESIDDLLKLLNDNQIDQVSDYLQCTGNPNVSMHSNMRPLFLARSAEMADLLIEAGADVNAIDEIGRTAAHLIAGYDARLPALQRLVKAGANLSRIDSHFETPLDVAHREKALANAAWLESIGAEPGPLATYRRIHPLRRIVSATRPAGPMPSLAQPIHDRSALWRHLRELIRFWDPTVDWQLIDRAATAATLNSLAGIELPTACLEFQQSGIFDWISWKGGQKEYAVARCSWAAAEAIGRRPADEFIPIMQDSSQGLYCLERDELGNADPAVRFLPRQDLSNAHRKPPYSYHTGCRFSEFIAIVVYTELVEVTPARRFVDLQSGDEPSAIRLRERLTRTALPRLRCGGGSVTFVTIYEGPEVLYEEIESPSARQSYYGILGGDSEEALSELVGEEETDDH